MSLALNTPADVLRKLRKTSAGDLFFSPAACKLFWHPLPVNVSRIKFFRFLSFNQIKSMSSQLKRDGFSADRKTKTRVTENVTRENIGLIIFLTWVCVVVGFARARSSTRLGWCEDFSLFSKRELQHGINITLYGNTITSYNWRGEAA